MVKRKLIIDTDPGIDDAMAIVFACLHDEIDVIGLTTIFGNVSTETATRNACALAELVDQDIPVARGSDIPLVQAPRPFAWKIHGREGFGDVQLQPPAQKSLVDETAAEFICRTVQENPGEVDICAIGPLTNLALALRSDPSISEVARSVVVMGGSLDAGGNASKAAEANIWQDPHAANVVFSAPWDVTIVGLDVTKQVVCSPEDFSMLAVEAPTLGGFLDRAVQYYFAATRERSGISGCHMHDPTAVIAVIRRELFTIRNSAVEVIESGEKAGATVWSDSAERPSVSVCCGVDNTAVRHLFLRTIEGGF